MEQIKSVMEHCVMNIYLSHSSNKRFSGVRRLLCLLTVAIAFISLEARAEILDQDMAGLRYRFKREALKFNPGFVQKFQPSGVLIGGGVHHPFDP